MSEPVTPSEVDAAEIETVYVRAPSRLHFGLLRASGEGRLFGGAGVMIDRPAIDLRLDKSVKFAAFGNHSQRVRRFAEAWATYYSRPELPTCLIEVFDSPREHVGLGVGTQLGLAVAAALSLAYFGERPKIEELAASVQRGARSAVGAHGFHRGGLILDAGKNACEGGALATLDERIELPWEWRFVLFCPREEHGLSGREEKQAFADLPPTPEETVARLSSLLYDGIAPAARAGDFDLFADALFEYGRLAGSCFAARQGGPWRSEGVARLVEGLREMGVAGVGQSSWGPTVFALVKDEIAALELSQQAAKRWGEAIEHTIAAQSILGAKISAAGGS